MDFFVLNLIIKKIIYIDQKNQENNLLRMEIALELINNS